MNYYYLFDIKGRIMELVIVQWEVTSSVKVAASEVSLGIPFELSESQRDPLSLNLWFLRGLVLWTRTQQFQ